MLISHPGDNVLEEMPLVRHLINVGDACRKKVRRMHLDLTLISHETLERLTFLIGIFHDFGKATTFFQEYVRNPEKKGNQFTYHSFLSAVTAFHFIKQELDSEEWAYVAFQVIQRHHNDLRDFDQSDDEHLRSALKTAKIQLMNIIKFSYRPLEDFYSGHIDNFETLRRMNFDELTEATEASDQYSADVILQEDEKLNGHQRTERFFIVNLLFSLLCDHDKKDAARLKTDYFDGNLDEPPTDVFAHLDELQRKNPGSFSRDIPINRLRCEFLEELAGNPDISPHNHFYTVTAPTGIGKTFGCLAFANRLKSMLPPETGRIIYCLPYTSIIDQNYREFEAVFHHSKGEAYRARPARYLMRHHHLTPKSFRKVLSTGSIVMPPAALRGASGGQGEAPPGPPVIPCGKSDRNLDRRKTSFSQMSQNALSRRDIGVPRGAPPWPSESPPGGLTAYNYRTYREDVLMTESWESAMMVTTFVQFFHTIIGYSNRNLKKFHNIVNSIVILDEVQNINPDYYRLLRRVLHVLGERFNIYFLLITATQPEILDRDISKPVALVNGSKYMKDPLFNRVMLTIRPDRMTLEEFQSEFFENFEGDNCLIVLNTKGAAVDVYRGVKEHKTGYRVFCLTTFLTPLHRREKIAEIKTSLKAGERIIVVATQMIEAGVDLSFREVYRDFGPMDSIIQVAGRCNRSGEYGHLGGHMTLVELVDENNNHKSYQDYVYPAIITQMVRQVLTKEEYRSTDFETLSAGYFKRFDFERESRKLLKSLESLNYDSKRNDVTPVNDFRLIKEYDSETVHILVTPEAQETMEMLLESLATLMEEGTSDERKNALRLRIENLKTVIKDFQLSLRIDELIAYKDSNIIKGNETYYQYITYEDQATYAYDSDTGFLKEPKQQVSGAVFI